MLGLGLRCILTLQVSVRCVLEMVKAVVDVLDRTPRTEIKNCTV